MTLLDENGTPTPPVVDVASVLEGIVSDEAREKGVTDPQFPGLDTAIVNVRRSAVNTALTPLLVSAGQESNTGKWGSPEQDVLLASAFTPNTPEAHTALVDFFQEYGPYSHHKGKLLKAMAGVTSPRLRVFLETELAKEAPMTTITATQGSQDEYRLSQQRNDHIEALLKIAHTYRNPKLSDFLHSILRKDADKFRFRSMLSEQREDREMKRAFVDELKGSQSNPNECQAHLAWVLHQKMELTRVPSGEIEYALPSYAMFSLFQQGKLEELGISDEEFASFVRINETRGYLNFAHYDSMSRSLRVSGKRSSSDSPVTQAVFAEMKHIARDLVPTLTAEKMDGLSPSAFITGGLDVGVMYSDRDKVVYFMDEPSDSRLNELSRVVQRSFSPPSRERAA